MSNDCTCGNPEMGFNCTCEHTKANPGTNAYMCEYCGIYDASRPICSKCDLDEITTAENKAKS